MSLDMVKARLLLIYTTIRYSEDPAREKAVIVFPKGLVTNGHVSESYLNLARRGTIGGYHNIWKICAYTFELGAVHIVQIHQLLYRTYISVTNYLLIVFD